MERKSGRPEPSTPDSTPEGQKPDTAQHIVKAPDLTVVHEKVRCPRCSGEFVHPRLLRNPVTGDLVLDLSLVWCPLCQTTTRTDVPGPEVRRG